MAVASQYGIYSLRQTVGTVKFAVWKFLQRLFISRCAYFVLMLYCTLVCVFGGVVAWRSGNGVGRINEVTLRRARLVLGWVTSVRVRLPEAALYLGM